MAEYISEINVSVNKADKQNLMTLGFMKIDVDLNEGAGGDKIYIWFKRGSVPITKIQFAFNPDMAVGLSDAGYTKIDKDLNAGVGGNFIYLWYKRGSGEFDTPIKQLDLTVDAASEGGKFESDWERLACNLNRRAGGNYIHLWVKREKQTYICDVTAADFYGSDSGYFKNGYIRVDENTNRGTDGSPVFIWYRQTIDSKRALTHLDVSTSGAEFNNLQERKYKAVKDNLNEKTGGPDVYLWFKKDQVGGPIKGLTLLLNPAAVMVYMKAGVTVIEKNLNIGNGGCLEYLCVHL